MNDFNPFTATAVLLVGFILGMVHNEYKRRRDAKLQKSVEEKKNE